MKLRSAQGWLLLVGVLIVVGLAFDLMTRSRLSATTALQCEGDYADTLQIQSQQTREIEQGPRGQYSYLIRSTAKYECPFFAPDGKLRRRKVETTELGTAFAYELSGDETYLLTNEHVVSWPEVTDAAHRVDGVHEGCKRVEERIRIVRDEHDDYEPAQIPLVRVAVDGMLDAAILKASQQLNVLPYRIGKSAGLRQGNAVVVRGFPLGVMQAVSSGKVVNPYDRDQEQGWDHVDFVVDALLSEGNSGSPVLAMSCRSRNLELVGIYHAGYKGHGALNVVVGIDQLTEFMRKKKRVPRALYGDGVARNLGATDRGRVSEAVGGGATVPLFPFGDLLVRAELSKGALLYHLFGRQFPLDDRTIAVIEDLPEDGGFGVLGRLWVRGGAGWRVWSPNALGGDERDLLARVVDSMRLQVLHTLDYRRAVANPGSADDRKRARDLGRILSRDQPIARDLAASMLEMSERLSVGGEQSAVAAAQELPPAGAPLPPSDGPSAGR